MRVLYTNWWYVRYKGVTIYGEYLQTVSPVFIPTCDEELLKATAWTWRGNLVPGVHPAVKNTDLVERELMGALSNQSLLSITLLYQREPLVVVGFNAPKYGLVAKPARAKVLPTLTRLRRETGYSFFVRGKDYKFYPLEVYTPPPKYYLLRKYPYDSNKCLLCNERPPVWRNTAICRMCASKRATIYRIRDKYEQGLLIFKSQILEAKTVSMRELRDAIPPPYAKASVAVMTNFLNQFMVDDELFNFF